MAPWRSMTLDFRRCRRSCSSSLPGKAANSGVLQPAGDRPLFLKVDDVHPGRPWEVGVEEALIIAGNKHTNMEATHRKEKQLESCSTFTKIKIDQIWRVVS